MNFIQYLQIKKLITLLIIIKLLIKKIIRILKFIINIFFLFLYNLKKDKPKDKMMLV